MSDQETSAPADKLRLTNGYAINFEHFTRLLGAAIDDGTTRPRVKYMAEAVGLAASHAQFLCSIMGALDLLTTSTYLPTPLGASVAKFDPFFDDAGTLWALHYQVASESRNLIWSRFAEQFVPENSCFTLDELRASYEDLKESYALSSYKRHVSGETRSLLDAYTQQGFSRLAYLRADGEGYAHFYREEVPPLVLAALIARFRDRHRPGATALSVAELLEAPYSPGRICLLPADRLRAGLEQLKTQSGFTLESRADLDQVRLDDAPPHIWMQRYYDAR